MARSPPRSTTSLLAGCSRRVRMTRLSLRSLVATVSFMAAGFATVYLLRHLF